LECNISGASNHDLAVSDFSGKDNQLWKIENSYMGLYNISNTQFPSLIISVNADLSEGNKAGIANSATGSSFGWILKEVCESKEEAFRSNTIPGTIEAEDFDIGCPDDAYYDRDQTNAGAQYRPGEGVDIEKCSAGGYNVGWTHTGEWMAYSVTVTESATYQITFYIASGVEGAKLHLECDGADITGIVSIPNTVGYQNWEAVNKTVKLDAGQHVLKLVVDGEGLNLDKIVFKEINEE